MLELPGTLSSPPSLRTDFSPLEVTNNHHWFTDRRKKREIASHIPFSRWGLQAYRTTWVTEASTVKIQAMGDQRKDGGYKDFSSCPFMKKSKSQLTAEQPQTKNPANYHKKKKKVLYIQRQRSHNQTGREMLSWYSQIQEPLSRWHANWKIIILQRFSHSNGRVQNPPPACGSVINRRSPLALMASRDWVQKLHRIGGNTHSILGRHTQGFMYTRTQGKAVTP